MIGFIETWRIDDVGGLDTILQVKQSDARSAQPGKVRNDVELGDLAALDHDPADACDAIEGRFELIRGKLPELGL